MRSDLPTIWITGVSSGIGLATAKYFLAQNYSVCGIGRRNSIFHPNYRFFELDLTNSSAVNSFRFSGIQSGDVLINNAGIVGEILPATSVSHESIEDVFTVNTSSACKLANQFAREAEEGVILFISSGAAQRPVKGWGAYCASKAAVDMYARVMQEEFEYYHQPFIVKSIAPGVVDSPMQAHIRSSKPEFFPDHPNFIALHTHSELDHPELTARKLSYLLTNLAKFPKVIYSLRSIYLPD